MGRKPVEKKMTQVNVRLPVLMAQRLESLAVAENRTLSNYLRGILGRFLEGQPDAVGGAR